MKRYYTTATDGNVFEHPDGPFVLYAEHEAEVAALKADRDGLIADLKDSRAIAAEQEDAHVAANMRNSALAAELTQAKIAAHESATDASIAWERGNKYESALTLLTNGYKYSTEVVRIAREALGEKT